MICLFQWVWIEAAVLDNRNSEANWFGISHGQKVDMDEIWHCVLGSEWWARWQHAPAFLVQQERKDEEKLLFYMITDQLGKVF